MTTPAFDSLRADWAWLDRIFDVDAQERTATASRSFTKNEWYFAHHFPSFPVVPGVLMIEAMAHSAGILQTLRARRCSGAWHNHVLLAVQDARFYRFVGPGEELTMKVELLSDSDQEELLARCIAFVGDERAARCRLTLRQVDTRELEGTQNTADPFGLMRYLGLILDDTLKRRYDLVAR